MHDRNGNAIQKGDVVFIEALVTDTHGGEDYCNVTLAIGAGKPHGPANVTATVTLNARQTLLFKRE